MAKRRRYLLLSLASSAVSAVALPACSGRDVGEPMDANGGAGAGGSFQQTGAGSGSMLQGGAGGGYPMGAGSGGTAPMIGSVIGLVVAPQGGAAGEGPFVAGAGAGSILVEGGAAGQTMITGVVIEPQGGAEDQAGAAGTPAR